MDKRYKVNPLSILFHPEIDKKNNYETIVCNWETEKVLKINPFGYHIFKVIDENPEISLKDIYLMLSLKVNNSDIDANKVVGFIQQMVKEAVLQEI